MAPPPPPPTSTPTPAAPPKTLAQAADQDIAVEASLKTTGLASADVLQDGSSIVPVIDLSVRGGTQKDEDEEEEIAKQLWQAATQVGFFVVTGHGIPQSLIDQAFQVSQQFFQQSLTEKQQQSPLDMSINCGYEFYNQVRPSTGLADQKESLQITAREGCMDGRWPTTPPELEQTAKSLLEHAHALAARLLNLLQPTAVPQAAPGTLAQSHTLWSRDGQCTLRMLHYPPQEPTVTKRLLQEGYWRAGAHTDWSNLTILFQQVGQKGLECCANPRTATNPKDMYWTAVDPVPGGIAVNIGDMLARWSDGKLYSNLHRVRLPQDASTSRYSIAFFAQSDKGTLIESKDSEPITAGDYLLSRIQSNFAELSKKE